ncbi:MAG: UDP-N-acetylmuramoyl-L-alanine--D-glutamate ligase [Rickettsia endosymbiont of Pentastiridius leporinus]
MTSHKKQKIGIFGLGKTGMSVYEELKDRYTVDTLKTPSQISDEMLQRTIVHEHSGSYKDDIANLRDSASIYEIIIYDDLETNRNIFEKLFGKNLIVSLSDPRWQQLDKIVLSPGIPLTHEILKIANNFNIPVISDIDLLFEKSENLNFIAVTGTNGKSTTTALISHILNSNGLDYPIAGNIGVPALKAKRSKDGYVLELSSFQLDLVKTFTAKIAILLNITPDHLDRHKDMQNYIAAKSKIFDRMGKDNYGVINIDNDYCREVLIKLQQESDINLIPFSVTKILEKGISVIDNKIYDNFFDNSIVNSVKLGYKEPRQTPIIIGETTSDDVGEFKSIDYSYELLPNKNLQGTHNRENIAASYAVAKIIGLEPVQIINSLGKFQSLPHRMQYVGNIKDINFYNDSKATNAIAAMQSIKALDNIYWLAGGMAKEGGIEEIISYFSNRPFSKLAYGREFVGDTQHSTAAYTLVREDASSGSTHKLSAEVEFRKRSTIKKAYFYGQAKEMFAETAKNIVDFVICDDLKQAFELAYKDACGDDGKVKNILLAPSCSSYDQFKNFEERGELFIKLCKKIIGQN